MRARNLKPSFFKNELLGSADPLFGIIFQGLWCLADRAGRLEDRPLRIHVEVNPYRNPASTVQALDWLVQEGFVIRYEAGGTRYLQVSNFTQHQQPHIKEAPSKIPHPENQELTEAPDEPGADTGLAALTPSSLTPSSLIPDSGFLIPHAPHVTRAGATPASSKQPRPNPEPIPPASTTVLLPRAASTNREAFARFEALKAAYPKFAGRQDWPTAEHHVRRLADEGPGWDALQAGVTRYAAYVAAGGVSSTAHVMTPAKFFTGRDTPWAQPWEPPVPIERDADDPAAALRRTTWRPDPSDDDAKEVHRGIA
jgi:hypothetical protein